ncbi:Rieske (2Fe-2S) protein [Paraburkholderia rhizosphaerae]|uniref:3-phenylpropionate/trans-cinnamate dioxygenase ferredoxin subunit n=1 Tax=Paraburkholderia rhizosphaerae TaxID=480658 RepID=A0A4R8LKK9_9BURK|nr:Rieske 2Fe-2S domain-containing protein [Paraburkholderia rhizosphaerae]TDY43954.1 3-phenylpropionate/trans-cinnamate dioxygenase ferredoxin subunit [Paraburkholderia rhizosphaerae]
MTSSSPETHERPCRIVAGTTDELAPGQRKLLFVGGRSIVLFNVDGMIRAIDNDCPHNGASLANGQLDGTFLRCPAHGLRFDLRTGRTPGAGGLGLRTFPVDVVEGRFEVAVDARTTNPCGAMDCANTTRWQLPRSE